MTVLEHYALPMAFLGGVIVAAVMIKVLCNRLLAVPPLIGYLLLGLLLRLAGQHFGFLTEAVRFMFEVMASLGLFALLFRVGLESHPRALANKLPQAGAIWLGNVFFAGAAGFVAAYYWLDLALLPSLVIGTALTATSVGVSVAIWEEAGTLHSETGELLVDVAELDDISAIALMAVLFAVIPVWLQGGELNLWTTIAGTGGVFLLKLGVFIGFCLLFAYFIERRLTRFSGRLALPPEPMLLVVGLGLLIAALADGLGFSLAIGALFAGLIFSGDPEVVKSEPAFIDLYAFVVPFFFVNIGLGIDPASLGDAVSYGGALVMAALFGKLIGAGLPALLSETAGGALLIGISMMPRAEIAMIVAHQGHKLGPQVLSNAAYSGMILVTMVSCLLTPLILHPILKRRISLQGTTK